MRARWKIFYSTSRLRQFLSRLGVKVLQAFAMLTPSHTLRRGPPAIKRGCLGLQNLNLRCRYSTSILLPPRRRRKHTNHTRRGSFHPHLQVFARFLACVSTNTPIPDHFHYTPTSFCQFSCMCVPNHLIIAYS